VLRLGVVPALAGGGPGPAAAALLGLLAVAAVPLGGLAGTARRVAARLRPPVPAAAMGDGEAGDA
jgi:hypothetical protein